jgi:8-oxo-dGTP diphosphatase
MLARMKTDGPTPYKIACLCELRDARGRVLLLHRRKPPNRDLYSPIGGKLETQLGESPTACALREIEEEAGLRFTADQVRLVGIVSERAYAPETGGEPTHWCMYWYRVLPAVDHASVPASFDEGTLEWFTDAEVDALPLPATDREAIWPAVRAHTDGQRLGFFMLHLDCSGEAMLQTLEQSVKPGRAALR